MTTHTKKNPGAPGRAAEGNGSGFGKPTDSTDVTQTPQPVNAAVEVEYSCPGHLVSILRTSKRPRSNGRHTIVIHKDEDLIAWATWWGHRCLWHIVLLPRGPDWFRYDSLPDFLRIVEELVEVETTDELVKIWGSAL